MSVSKHNTRKHNPLIMALPLPTELCALIDEEYRKDLFVNRMKLFKKEFAVVERTYKFYMTDPQHRVILGMRYILRKTRMMSHYKYLIYHHHSWFLQPCGFVKVLKNGWHQWPYGSFCDRRKMSAKQRKIYNLH